MKRLFLFITAIFACSVLCAQVFIDQKPVKIIKKQDGPILCLAFSYDGKMLASGSDDKTCIVWSFPEGKEIKSYAEHNSGVRSIIFTPEYKYFFTAGDKTVKLYNKSDEQINKYSGPATYIWSMAYSARLNQIVLGSYDKNARIVDLASGKLIKSLEGHAKSVLSVDYSPNSQFIATGSLDETVKIWDAKSFTLLKTFTGHGGNIYDVCFTPDSKYVISASNDNSARVWDISTGETKKNLLDHTKGVACLAVSPDGNYLLTGSYDATIKLWDINRGECIYTFVFQIGDINTLAYHPDGNYFASGSSDKSIAIWELKPEIFVSYYYTKEYDQEVTNDSTLFAGKAKDESKSNYKVRQEKQETFRKQLIDKLYQRYLSEIKGKEK